MKIVDVGAGPRLFLISDSKLLAMFLRIFHQNIEIEHDQSKNVEKVSQKLVKLIKLKLERI